MARQLAVRCILGQNVGHLFKSSTVERVLLLVSNANSQIVQPFLLHSLFNPLKVMVLRDTRYYVAFNILLCISHKYKNRADSIGICRL
jgi:hypothetical protein